MTNDVKNVPEWRFAGFVDEWEKKLLNEIANVQMGQSPNSKNYTDDSQEMILVQGNADLKNGKVFPRIFTKEITKLANIGDILLSVRAPVGEIGISQMPVCIGRGVCSITSNLFIYYFLDYFNNENKWKKFSQGSTFESISGNEVRSLIIYLPSKTEQQKIGDFFSKLDRQIELEEQKLAKLEEQKKGYMQQIFSQQLRFKDENGNEYPEWEEKKLGDILERGNKDKVNEIGKYRRLTISLHGKGLYEVKQERKTKDTRPFYQRFEGELIIGKQNFFNGSIAIVTKEFNGFICSNAIMSYKISNHMNRKYLLEYLLQNDFLRKNEYLADGTGQKELSEKKFEELEIKLPNSINEQQKIGVFLERLDNLIEKQSNKLELLKQRKKSFLQKMFV
ncbi:restriction endonuclease subunit S [Staphylococcus condimenti]|uniref:restriction endonuclease subunit S n=1 Tax=Staphylococcus condimenti TaxID=70255 RepID=UPI0019527F88|nr:restriction endonuclease subunit S [Staphylococcus condimenti]QRP95260.1 restriction endonuclease subunit S [Staphylococcus condimenti]